jgi:threonine synthase
MIMRLISLGNPDHEASFAEAVTRGIAPDGGLYFPAAIPRLPSSFFEGAGTMTFQEIAIGVCSAMLDGEIPGPALRAIIETALTFPAPVRVLDERTSILELFHGPTLAFKDFGARFLAQVLGYLQRGETTRTTILVATSGDTGSAVGEAFLGMDGFRVVLLYPAGRVSSVQEMQLTTIGGNVSALEVRGSFDDCQHMVKLAFADKELAARARLTSANSINFARLLPQTFYYVSAFGQLAGLGKPLTFAVPSGNLGNLTAGLIAWRMGLPVKRFIAATNANDVFHRFMVSGIYAPAPAVNTISNAMDVGDPNNFPRVLHLFGGKVDPLRAVVQSARCTDAETLGAVEELERRFGRIIDPHGAVAFKAWSDSGPSNPESHGVVLQTAHAAKFMDSYDPATRSRMEIPERLRPGLRGPKQALGIPPAFDALKEYLMHASA